MGQGQVDPKFFSQLAASTWRGPISLHVEYLHEAGLEANIKALGSDLATLKQALGTS